MGEAGAILVRQDCGHIHLKLKERLDERHMTRNALARKIGTRFEVIDKWYNDEVEKIDVDILVRICFVLDCGVDDILEYIK